MVVAGTSARLGDAAGLARQLAPHVVVLATASRDQVVVASIRTSRAVSPALTVVLVAPRADEPYVRMMLEAGARGYVTPDDPDLGRVVRAVAAGGAYFSPDVARVIRRGYLRRGGVSVHALLGSLTDAERAVLRGLVHGQTTGEIGAQLRLSRSALDACRRHIVETLAS